MEENQNQAETNNKPFNPVVIIAIVVAIIVIGIIAFVGSRGASSPSTTETQTSSQANPTTTTVTDTTDTVSIETQNFAFSPKTIRIKAGGTITFKNLDSVAHSLTADDGKSFDSGLITKNKTTTITAPSEPGEYPFHCTPHPYMRGTLIVE